MTGGYCERNRYLLCYVRPGRYTKKFTDSEPYFACVGGSSGTVINLVVGFFVGLSSGATVVVSHAYEIMQEHCLHCGSCYERCPVQVMRRRECI